MEAGIYRIEQDRKHGSCSKCLYVCKPVCDKSYRDVSIMWTDYNFIRIPDDYVINVKTLGMLSNLPADLH